MNLAAPKLPNKKEPQEVVQFQRVYRPSEQEQEVILGKSRLIIDCKVIFLTAKGSLGAGSG